MKITELINNVKISMDGSELKKNIAAGKMVINDKYEKLTEQEIEQLAKQGNFAEDWGNVFKNKNINLNRIWNNYFYGKVILSNQKGTLKFEGIDRNTGIYNSSLANVFIDEDVLIFNVNMLQNYIVKKGVVISNCKSIINSPGALFGNGVEIPVAIETGGREVRIFSDMTIQMGEILALNRDKKDIINEYNSILDKYIEDIKFDYGIINTGAVVKNNVYIKNSYIGASAQICNVTRLENTLVYSNNEEETEIKDGAYVVDSIIQWGCEVASMGIVDSSLLTEHSHVERHGKVTQSLIGPNTGIAEGEVTASLVGPFVGFHHQSLLIAALWPEGKGNIGYGANVGSNHTAKAPDQEIWPGEGTFFGLGVNIKFPSNFTKAPYSIIATGVSALPQKLEMPFSLINEPAAEYEGISPAFNEIFPAWVLSDNIYTIKRNEGKYIKRNKAKRSNFVFEVFRPDIVDLMIEARKRLSSVSEIKDLYLEKDIPGIGKNFLLERNRKKAIETYSFYIEYYALIGMKRKLEELTASGESLNNLLTSESSDMRWEHERNILNNEFQEKDLKKLLELLKSKLQKISDDVKTAKEKDDKRGKRIIPDYEFSHTLVADDGFVKQTIEETEKELADLDELIKKV